MQEWSAVRRKILHNVMLLSGIYKPDNDCLLLSNDQAAGKLQLHDRGELG